MELMLSPQFLHVPSSSIKVKITANCKYSCNNPTFDPIKKLFKHTAQTFETLIINKNNPPPSKQPLKPNLLANIFNTLDDFICTFLDSKPLPPPIDPKYVLSGNFAPVDELPPTACVVVDGGALPSCLDGAYIRNGPNPQFFPKSPYHFLDGDGMLHVIKICQGKATFCSRYVKTHKYIMEGKIGHPIVPNFIAGFNGVVPGMARLALTCARVLTKQFDPLTHGFGVGNTSVALLCGRLFALCESDLPYEVKITENGDIITLGRHDFESREPFFRMTAHPKTDKATGEAFCYGYDFLRPFLTFYRIDGGGRKQKGVGIFSMGKNCAVVHDFGLTENFIVFSDAQIVINPLWVMRGRSPVGIDLDKIPRLGIISRYAEDDSGMWWIDTPGFNMLHCVNAWEEDGGAGAGDTVIVMVASKIESVEKVFEITDLPQSTMEKVTINVKAKTVERQSLSTQGLDFAAINPAYAAKKIRCVI
ncbi:hypothetical protein DH2020_049291 [Rehmannia glutinosa]|uniref:Uncharacterized protein n=1 Tax=Rehmannia glutinosa TaxID=99300 RepID=A0ABR0U359_REHGL